MIRGFDCFVWFDCFVSRQGVWRGPGQSGGHDHQVQQQLGWIQSQRGHSPGGREWHYWLKLWLHPGAAAPHPGASPPLPRRVVCLRIPCCSKSTSVTEGPPLCFQLKCCGMNGSSDWRNFRPDGMSVPDSCCVNVSANCGIGAMTDSAKVHHEVKFQSSSLSMTFKILGNMPLEKKPHLLSLRQFLIFWGFFFSPQHLLLPTFVLYKVVQTLICLYDDANIKADNIFQQNQIWTYLHKWVEKLDFLQSIVLCWSMIMLFFCGKMPCLYRFGNCVIVHQKTWIENYTVAWVMFH